MTLPNRPGYSVDDQKVQPTTQVEMPTHVQTHVPHVPTPPLVNEQVVFSFSWITS